MLYLALTQRALLLPITETHRRQRNKYARTTFGPFQQHCSHPSRADTDCATVDSRHAAQAAGSGRNGCATSGHDSHGGRVRTGPTTGIASGHAVQSRARSIQPGILFRLPGATVRMRRQPSRRSQCITIVPCACDSGRNDASPVEEIRSQRCGLRCNVPHE